MHHTSATRLWPAPALFLYQPASSHAAPILPAVSEMSWCFADAREDPAVGVIILTGEGPLAFCRCAPLLHLRCSPGLGAWFSLLGILRTAGSGGSGVQWGTHVGPSCPALQRRRPKRARRGRVRGRRWHPPPQRAGPADAGKELHIQRTGWRARRGRAGLQLPMHLLYPCVLILHSAAM